MDGLIRVPREHERRTPKPELHFPNQTSTMDESFRVYVLCMSHTLSQIIPVEATYLLTAQ